MRSWGCTDASAEGAGVRGSEELGWGALVPWGAAILHHSKEQRLHFLFFPECQMRWFGFAMTVFGRKSSSLQLHTESTHGHSIAAHVTRC